MSPDSSLAAGGSLLASPQGTPAGEASGLALDAMRDFEREEGVTLAEEQREAILKASTSGVFVITGGPGVGKTTIVKCILAMLTRAGLEVRLAASTGRAAKRMTELTGHEPPATTIHRLLEYGQGGNEAFQRHAGNPIEADAVIVDEVSMLDIHLADALFQAIGPGTRLILVGDVDQLPSVDVGAVLRDVLFSKQIPSVRLTKIFRQAERSYIVTNAHRINRGEAPIDPAREEKKREAETARAAGAPPAVGLEGEASPAPEGPSIVAESSGLSVGGASPLASPQGTLAGEAPSPDFYIVYGSEPEKAEQCILDFVTKRIPAKFGLDPMKDIQVLTPMHRGFAGTESLNIALQKALNPFGAELTRGKRTFRVRDKVMQTKNDRENNVYNGEIGEVVSIEGQRGGLIVRFDGDREIFYSLSTLENLMLAYAQSIHKSQGNEYKAVVIAFLKSHYMMLSRNLLYTAVTRGKQLVVLVCDPRAVKIALSTERKDDRRSRLATRIVHAMRTK